MRAIPFKGTDMSLLSPYSQIKGSVEEQRQVTSVLIRHTRSCNPHNWPKSSWSPGSGINSEDLVKMINFWHCRPIVKLAFALLDPNYSNAIHKGLKVSL